MNKLQVLGPFRHAPAPRNTNNLLHTLLLSLVLLAVLILITGCAVTTAPDGTETKRVDQEAVNPWLLLARDLFLTPAPPVAPIVIRSGK